MLATLEIAALIVFGTCVAHAGKKSDLKMFIAGQEDNGFQVPDLSDSAKDLKGYLDDHFVLTEVAAEADLVLIVTSRSKTESGSALVSNGAFGTSVDSKPHYSLSISIVTRDGRSIGLVEGFTADAPMPGMWKGIARNMSKQVRKFVETNGAAIRAIQH